MKKAISLCKAIYREIEDNIVTSGFQLASSAKIERHFPSRGATKAAQCTCPLLTDDLLSTLARLIAERMVGKLLPPSVHSVQGHWECGSIDARFTIVAHDQLMKFQSWLTLSLEKPRCLLVRGAR